MPITIKPFLDMQRDKQKMYFVSIIYEKYVSWEFCMRVLKDVFHKTQDEAALITDEILTDGEGFCGGFMFEIAEHKAEIVESMAKKEGFSMCCLVEEA